MCGQFVAEKLSIIHLSGNMTSQGIHDMTGDVLIQLLAKVGVRPYFSLQLDESKDKFGTVHVFYPIR